MIFFKRLSVALHVKIRGLAAKILTKIAVKRLQQKRLEMKMGVSLKKKEKTSSSCTRLCSTF